MYAPYFKGFFHSFFSIGEISPEVYIGGRKIINQHYMTKQLRTFNEDEEKDFVYLSDLDKYHLTFDLGCAAALISIGYELCKLNKENPRKVQFVFHRTKGLDEAVDEYWADTLKLPARSLFDNTKMLKNRIYSD